MTAKTNILLVDDRPENLVVLEAILAPLGQNLVFARSGAEALKHLLADEFAVILLDVQMPTMDGFETATLIRQRTKSSYIPIIFITALNRDDRYITQAYEAGAVDYIFKPFDPSILRSKVSVFVDLYRQRQQIQRQAELLRQSELREMERKHEERDRTRRVQASRQLEMRQRAFLQDVLASATSGKLHLCTRRSELPKKPQSMRKTVTLSPDAIARMRKAAREAGQICKMADERINDLVTAASEAAMNAVVHAGGGCGRICVTEGSRIQIWIEDEGQGIKLHHLPRATLERGFTTAGTLGHGFWLMLQMVDDVWLLSSTQGTTIVLEQGCTPPEPDWLKHK